MYFTVDVQTGVSLSFQKLCLKAYMALRDHAHLIITLFTMMLSCGIPELQSLDDIGYIRKTLAVEKTKEEAATYFSQQFRGAFGDSWTTKVDWFLHYLKHAGNKWHMNLMIALPCNRKDMMFQYFVLCHWTLNIVNDNYYLNCSYSSNYCIAFTVVTNLQ